MDKVKKFIIVYSIKYFLFILFLIYITGTYKRPHTYNKTISTEVDFVNTINNNEFNEDSLISFMKFLNIKHPDIVFAQAKLESGNFNSKIFRENNNLFGMRYPQSRNNTAKDSKNGYAVYSSWKQSVIDYALFQSSYLRGFNNQQYLKYLSDNYASDPEYINKLKKIIEK